MDLAAENVGIAFLVDIDAGLGKVRLGVGRVWIEWLLGDGQRLRLGDVRWSHGLKMAMSPTWP